METTNNRLFLLDAYALIFRAYYAFAKNPLINSKGQNVSAISGFTSTLFDLLRKENPTHIAVCFDTHAKTERHNDFADYKANRQETPEDILSATPWIRKIIRAFNIPILEVDGYEADDVIGTLAKKAEQHGYKVFMMTPDKDFGQLVSENIFIYKPPHLGNTFEILGVEEVKKRWEIENVMQVIDILGMMGDAVDNIPGIKGVGEKTASKLLKEFGTLENVLANADGIKGAMGEKIRNGKADAIMSKKLATIILNVPVEWNEEALTRTEPDKEKLTEIFSELEFRTLGKRILGESYAIGSATPSSSLTAEKNSLSAESAKAEKASTQKDLFGNNVASKNLNEENEIEQKEIIPLKNIADTEHNYILCDTEEKIISLLEKLESANEFCFDSESTGVDANNAELVGLSFSFKEHEGFYVPISADKNEAQQTVNRFKKFLEDETKMKIGQNIKYDMLLLKWYGVEVQGKMFDTMLAHYLIEPDQRHGMDYLSENYLGYRPVSITELIGKKGKGQGTMRDVELEKIKEYAAEDADVTLQLKEKFAPMLKEQTVEKLFTEVEVPLVEVLCAMEFEGVKIDENFLRDYSSLLEKDIVRNEKEVYELAGVRFNLASPKQLGEVLFDKLKIPYEGKKTKTGQYSTDDDMLSRLEHKNPIAVLLRDYRELTKLKSTYVDSIPQLINPKTGRVHTSFNQAVAATGRLSSTDPNLQNIPIRTERGREIRKAFIPRNEEYVLLSADYSQIELRIIAALSEDENMLDAFHQKQDIHAATAAKVFGVPLEEVTRDMRGRAKAVNFGIAYGQTAFGLAQNLGISRTEAKEIIDNYNMKFPGVTRLMQQNISFAREHGYAETILGRKRYLRDINSANATIRGFAERNAINAPIQGSAADMIKVAMINIHREMKKMNLKSKMTLQVHDELVFDVHKNEIEILKPMIEEKMRTAVDLKCPVEVGMGVGNNWLDAH